jgi:hypothetical protein
LRNGGTSRGFQSPPRRSWLVRWGGIELARGDDRPQRASAAPAVGAGTAHGGNFFGCRRTTCDRVGHGLVGGPDTKADVHQQTPTARSAIASRVIGTTGETAERTRRMLVESNLSRLVESNLSQRQAIESPPARDAPTVRQTLRRPAPAGLDSELAWQSAATALQSEAPAQPTCSGLT